MKILHTSLLIFGILLLVGCGATKYAPMRHSYSGIEMGYLEAQLDSTTWQVSFIANPVTEIGLVNRYVLFRAAELTAQHGFDYFLVLDYWNNSKASSVNIEPKPQIVSCPDSSINTSYSQPWVQFVEGTRSAAVTVRMMHGRSPVNNSRAYDAHFVIASMGPSIVRGD